MKIQDLIDAVELCNKELHKHWLAKLKLRKSVLLDRLAGFIQQLGEDHARELTPLELYQLSDMFKTIPFKKIDINFSNVLQTKFWGSEASTIHACLFLLKAHDVLESHFPRIAHFKKKLMYAQEIIFLKQRNLLNDLTMQLLTRADCSPEESCHLICRLDDEGLFSPDIVVILLQIHPPAFVETLIALKKKQLLNDNVLMFIKSSWRDSAEIIGVLQKLKEEDLFEASYIKHLSAIPRNVPLEPRVIALINLKKTGLLNDKCVELVFVYSELEALVNLLVYLNTRQLLDTYIDRFRSHIYDGVSYWRPFPKESLESLQTLETLNLFEPAYISLIFSKCQGISGDGKRYLAILSQLNTAEILTEKLASMMEAYDRGVRHLEGELLTLQGSENFTAANVEAILKKNISEPLPFFAHAKEANREASAVMTNEILPVTPTPMANTIVS